MRNADATVGEYLKRGFSLESLRLLAETRGEPERSGLLEAIERRVLDDGDGEPAEVSCETAVFRPAGVFAGEPFFVAGDDEPAADGEGVDLLRAVDAAGEAPIAGIPAGEDRKGGETAAAAAELEDAGIWSRFSRGAVVEAVREETPAPSDSSRPAALPISPDAPEPSIMEAVQVPEVFSESAPLPAAELPVLVVPLEPLAGLADAVGDPDALADDPAAADIAAMPDVIADAVMPAATAEVAAAISNIADVSHASAALTDAPSAALADDPAAADIAAMPAAVGEVADAAMPAIAADIAVMPAATAEVAAAAGDSAVQPARPLENSVVPVSGREEASAPPDAGSGVKLSRRERRRQAKDKRRLVKAAQTPAAATLPELPEIVLTLSETGDALPTGAAADPEGALALVKASSRLPAWPEPVCLPPEAEAAGAAAAEPPRTGVSAGILTPCDVLDGSDGVFDESGAPRSDVILFRQAFSDYSAASDGGTEPPEELLPVLRLRGAAKESEAGAERAVPEEGGRAEDGGTGEAALSPLDRLGLLRALVGVSRGDADEEPEADASRGVSLSCGEDRRTREETALGEREAAIRDEARREGEAGLADLTRRFAEAESARGESEAGRRELEARLDGRDRELAESGERLARADARLLELERSLARLEKEAEAGRADAGKRAKLLSEHERLYQEFEDLRLAYNEVVSEVMPGLQTERDDLAATVDSQCAEAERLRASLSRSRRVQAAGYALGAAALLLLVLLPLFNWRRSGDGVREMAVDYQEASETRERLRTAEQDRDRAKAELAEIRRASALDKKKTERLEESNQRYERELAKLKAPAREGVPARTVDMALQGPRSGNDALRRNEVRDPAGSIREVAESNRRSRQDALLEPARGPALPVRMLTRVEGSGLRPPAAGAGADESRPATAAAGTVLVKVQAGEGVAQVVYRALGSRDPELIDWVVRENGLKANAKGNPLIYKDQELRLPRDGRLTQSASAGGR